MLSIPLADCLMKRLIWACYFIHGVLSSDYDIDLITKCLELKYRQLNCHFVNFRNEISTIYKSCNNDSIKLHFARPQSTPGIKMRVHRGRQQTGSWGSQPARAGSG